MIGASDRTEGVGTGAPDPRVAVLDAEGTAAGRLIPTFAGLDVRVLPTVAGMQALCAEWEPDVVVLIEPTAAAREALFRPERSGELVLLSDDDSLGGPAAHAVLAAHPPRNALHSTLLAAARHHREHRALRATEALQARLLALASELGALSTPEAVAERALEGAIEALGAPGAAALLAVRAGAGAPLSLTGTGRYRRVESELDVPSAVVELLLAASGYGGRVDRVDRALVIGLSGAAEVTGALYLERSDLPPSATDLCAMYARLVGQAISSAVLFRQSTVDALTGLYSREFGLHRLEQTLALGSRHGQVTSILALDVDHFKRVNDTHGHAGGDVVLNALGRLLLDSLRAGDFAARLGGEELLVVLPHTEEAGAMIVGERLRRLVAAWRGQHNGEDLQVTVSIGAAEAEPGERLTQDLLSRADDALYAAKSGGRNRVVRAGG